VIESEGHRHEKARGTAAFPPLGILYLGSVLRDQGLKVSALDQPAEGLTVEEAANWVTKEDPDILGFSTYSSSGRTAVDICKRVKEQNPNIITVFGNIYATLNPERILMKYPSIDLIVRGEGERTVTELVSCLEKGGNLREVRGVSFREGGRIISNPDQPLIENLDSIPFPDRKLLSCDYHSMILGVTVAPKKFTSIVSSRGCVYRCRFCNCTQFANYRWRCRSVQNTLQELNLLVGEGYKQFIFSDDNFTTNKKRVIELCRAIRREKMDIDLICEGRVDNCSYEMLWEMARAGCRVMYFGIESANQRILDYYHKQSTPQQAENAVKTARKAGMDIIIGSFIVGAPDETRDEIQNTINFAKNNPIDFAQFNILGAYPGMDIWSELVAKQIINEEEYWESGVVISKVCPGAVSFQEIKRMVTEATYDFLRRPSFILRELAMCFKSTFRINTILSNISRTGAIREGLRNMF
jgi:anaerobic magnesium-protoporphyrin IX monomethyl ester cyclase